jgi:hypothetical protein
VESVKNLGLKLHIPLFVTMITKMLLMNHQQQKHAMIINCVIDGINALDIKALLKKFLFCVLVVMKMEDA